MNWLALNDFVSRESTAEARAWPLGHLCAGSAAIDQNSYQCVPGGR